MSEHTPEIWHHKLPRTHFSAEHTHRLLVAGAGGAFQAARALAAGAPAKEGAQGARGAARGTPAGRARAAALAAPRAAVSAAARVRARAAAGRLPTQAVPVTRILQGSTCLGWHVLI